MSTGVCPWQPGRCTGTLTSKHSLLIQSVMGVMEQPEQSQDTSFLAVLMAPRQGIERAPELQEPQGSQLESTGPPDLSSSASGWG